MEGIRRRSRSSVQSGKAAPCLLYVLALEPLLRRLRDEGTSPSLHTWAGLWQGTQCGDERRVGLFLTSSQTQKLKVDVSLWAKHCLSASVERPFVTFLVTVTFHGPRKELYRELVVGSASDPLNEWRGWTAGEICSHWNWAPGSNFLNNSEFSLTWRLVRNALPLLNLNYKAGLADMTDCPRCGSGLEEMAEHAFFHCERVRPFWNHIGEWTARIEPKQLVLLDVGYVMDNVLPPFQGEKRVVFLTILAVAWMVIWSTRNKGLYDDANFSHRDLVLYFRHLLRVKIRCDKKRLDHWALKKKEKKGKKKEENLKNQKNTSAIVDSSLCGWEFPNRRI